MDDAKLAELLKSDCGALEFLPTTRISADDWILRVNNDFVIDFWDNLPKLFPFLEQMAATPAWQDFDAIAGLNWQTPLGAIPYTYEFNFISSFRAYSQILIIAECGRNRLSAMMFLQ